MTIITDTCDFRTLNLVRVIYLEIFHIPKQEAHRPRLAHLSEIATADMQTLCNIFSTPVIATNKIGSSFRAVLGF